MEEKERYELFSELCIKDNNINAECQLLNTYQSCVILNQQDKRIKELEEENKKANINNYLEDYFLAEKENQQLKQQLEDAEENIDNLELQLREQYQLVDEKVQQLHELPNKIVEEIENELLPEFSGPQDYEHKYYIITKRILDTILKKYEGKDE